jgi:hypothetical protein
LNNDGTSEQWPHQLCVPGDKKNTVEVITSYERIRDALPSCDANSIFAAATQLTLDRAELLLVQADRLIVK